MFEAGGKWGMHLRVMCGNSGFSGWLLGGPMKSLRPVITCRPWMLTQFKSTSSLDRSQKMPTRSWHAQIPFRPTVLWTGWVPRFEANHVFVSSNRFLFCVYDQLRFCWFSLGGRPSSSQWREIAWHSKFQIRNKIKNQLVSFTCTAYFITFYRCFVVSLDSIL